MRRSILCLLLALALSLLLRLVPALATALSAATVLLAAVVSWLCGLPARQRRDNLFEKTKCHV